MKKFLPFLFPFIALLIVIFLAIRWYHSKTQRIEGKIPEFAQDIKIDDLTQSRLDQLSHPAKDEKSIELKGSESSNSGQIRYELKDGKVYFTVYATLPELKPRDGIYQAFLKQVDGDARRRAFTLQFSKGGYMGSAAISATTLPFEVLVTKSQNERDMSGPTLLNGILKKE